MLRQNQGDLTQATQVREQATLAAVRAVRVREIQTALASAMTASSSAWATA